MSSKSPQAFFSTTDGAWFTGNDSARGPWSQHGCHGGPPTGMLARAAELAVTDKHLARLTVDLIRPVPMDGFRIETEVQRSGRATSTANHRLLDRDDKICATATSLHIVKSDLGEMPVSDIPIPRLENAEPGQFSSMTRLHRLPSFADSIEVLRPVGEPFKYGQNTIWMRTPALLEGETMSPFQRLCPISDCGNGMSRLADTTAVSFINPDLTIFVHRLPVSDWIASTSQSFWQGSGIGLAQATLFDTQGPIGTAHQTLLLRRS